jgi:hypothetical protein
MAAAAAAVFAGVPVAVYVSAVIACVAQTTVRPTQSALVPLVAATADQLTAVNVVSWLESAGMLTSGLLAGVLIALAGWGACSSCALALPWSPCCWPPACGCR